MKLQEIRTSLGELLNEATKKGAFDLPQANAVIQSLVALDGLIQQQPAAMAQADSDPIPPDPSKP
jgi:hypothetical protein